MAGRRRKDKRQVGWWLPEALIARVDNAAERMGLGTGEFVTDVLSERVGEESPKKPYREAAPASS